MASFRFVCELPTGLHARPASVLAETARRFHSAAVVTNEATGASAEARSVLSVIGLDVQRGHSVLVEASGDDADKFIEEVRGLVADKFGETEGGEAGEAAGAGFVARVPVPLRRAGVVTILGSSVCTGVGEGMVVWGGGAEFPKEYTGAAGGTVEEERARLAGAIDAVREEIEGALKKEKPGAGKDILSAHRGIIIDPALAGCMAKLIGSGMSAPGAVVAGAGQIASKLEHSASAYIRERAADVREVCRRLLGVLDPTWGGGVEKPIVLEGPSVVVAKELGVGQLTSMDRRNLKGLVLGDVGRTSHLVILARSMQIPTLIGVEMSATSLPGGARAIVDAIGGFVVASPGAAVMEYYRREDRARGRRGAKMAPLMARRGATRDGHALEVAANAAMAAEIAGAMEQGADSVGLLRTEMLFLDRATPPTEEEQYLLYRAAVEATGSTALESRATREVIIRTLDIGGDKPAPYITIPKEENPFLGCRGVRLYKRELDLLRSQLRAICRASAHGTVKVMAPMVATVGEAKWFCERIARAQAELCEEGVAHDPNMAVGIMLEVPSAALVIDQLAHVVDFISIGTNDLCQYTFAADRTNAGVAELNNPREPGFLRLLDKIVSEAAAHGVWVGICGEMAGDVRHLPLMVGLGVAGLDEISMGAPSIGPVKAKLAGVSAAECRAVLEKAMACETAEQVDAILDAFGSQAGSEMQGPLHSELILIDSDASTREDVIQELAGLLHAAGRTDDPRAVEEAAWVREEKGATGFGFGFCIPHAQTDAVACSSIAVARLRAPIEWPSMDGLPVGLAIMLTVRASDADQTHLKLLAKLARRLMHEGFRDALNGALSAAAMLDVLEAELELKRAG